MVIRRRVQKAGTLKPVGNALSFAADDLRAKIAPLLRAAAIVYAVLLLIAVPLTAFTLAGVTKNPSFTSNLTFMTDELSRFMKSLGSVTAGPGDYILAAVVVLYHRNMYVSLAFLLGSAFLYLFGSFGVEPLQNLIKIVGPETAGGIAAQCAFSGLLMGVIITSIFLPTILAYNFKRKSLIKYAVLNSLVGWFGPIWVTMIFFALRTPKEKRARNSKQDDAQKAGSSSGSSRVDDGDGKGNVLSQTSDDSSSSPPAARKTERKKKKGFRKK